VSFFYAQPIVKGDMYTEM